MATGPLIVIVGETASGKSALAMQIAKKFNGELISADSWTVYPGFNIGTAKPTPKEQTEIKHHLIDVANPHVGFSAAIYKDMAKSAIAEVAAHGKLPILVGGTGLYVDSVIYDYGFLPKSSENLRAELNNKSLNELLEQANENNINLDDVDTRNKRRVIRAIETNGQKPLKADLRENTLVIGVKRDAEHLLDRITKRVDAMLAAGLENEVSELYGLYGWESEPMKGIGYREWREYFEGTQDLETTRQKIIRASLGLAKRQRTWFKRNQNIQWCEDAEQALRQVEHFFELQSDTIAL
jgi:tRNA dimethylallyltransferase